MKDIKRINFIYRLLDKIKVKISNMKYAILLLMNVCGKSVDYLFWVPI